MRTEKTAAPAFDLFSQLWDSLGRVPAERIRLRPPLGTATEDDLLAAESRTGRLCELIDGTLVEKAMGWYESRVGGVLFRLIDEFVEANDLGFALPADGMVRVDDDRVRLPDVAFYSWRHFPDRVLPPGQILAVVPDLAVEVLSPRNTPAEMARKRREYFLGGCRLVWEIDAEKGTARAYSSPDRATRLGPKGSLRGGDVLPGFELPLADLFARAGRRPE